MLAVGLVANHGDGAVGFASSVVGRAVEHAASVTPLVGGRVYGLCAGCVYGCRLVLRAVALLVARALRPALIAGTVERYFL